MNNINLDISKPKSEMHLLACKRIGWCVEVRSKNSNSEKWNKKVKVVKSEKKRRYCMF